MKKTLLVAILLFPAVAMAQNVGNCGWGSKLFDGQKGIPAQVLAVTTNGTSGNQTFAISSGTSGCTQDGVVRTNWKTAAFIDNNMNKLAKDMSRGEGESLEALASVVGVDKADTPVFKRTLQANFANIFSAEQASSEQVYSNIKNVLASNKELHTYSVKL